jgi:hypothetical protein
MYEKTTNGPSEPPEMPAMAHILGQMEELIGHLENQVLRLNNIGDRLMGPFPNMEKDRPTSTEEGVPVLGIINYRFDRLRRIKENLISEVDRMQKLV